MRGRLGQRRITDFAAAAALIVAMAAISVIAARSIPVFAAAERWLIDVRVAYLAPRLPQHPQIVLVTITEDTLADLAYRSPLDRDFLAAVLQQIDEAGVRAIGLDMLIDQPTEPAKDERLRQTLAGLRAPAVVAAADHADGLTARQRDYLLAFTTGLKQGLVTLLTDPYDGTVRWIYPGRETESGFVPGFVPALAEVLGHPPLRDEVPLVYRLTADPATPPFRSFPAHLIAKLPAAWLAGKVVLIGSDLPHTDRHRTPLSLVPGAPAPTRPGVELHAHALAQLLAQQPPPLISLRTEIVTVALVAVAAMLIGALHLPILVHLAIGISAFAAFWLGAFFLFQFAGLLIPLVSASLTFALAFAAGNAFWHGRTRRQEHFIRTAFSRFLSPAVVRDLIRDPESLRLGGEKRDITCLFTDVAGFTSWLEASEPEQAITVLNDYLEGMCRVVFEHDGTLNKIIGDALYVIFGAPASQPDHAARAVTCAMALDGFAQAFSITMNRRGIPFGETRIGVHSGIAVVGNFGGKRFFDYTAYGDTVNIAARLEGANKHLGTRICVSGQTAGQTTEIRYRPIGDLIVAGRNEAIGAYEPLPRDAPESAYLDDYLAAYALMEDHQREAPAAMGLLAQRYPQDRLIAGHLRRLQAGEHGAVIRLKGK